MMKIEVDDLREIVEEPIKLFYQGIKASETKEKYTRTLRRVLCDILQDILEGSFEDRAAQFVSKGRTNPDWLMSVLLSLSRKLRQRTELLATNPDYLNPKSIENYIKPLKKLLDMNNVPVLWERVYATFPENDNNTTGRGYTLAEIQTMLEFTQGAIDRAIILTGASSGIREGGFRLKWKDVTPVYKIDGRIVLDITESEEKDAKVVCGILNVYSGTASQYPAFITPEAYNAILNYKKEWTRVVGREPKPHEPVFIKQGDLPIALPPTAVKKRVEDVLWKSGLRKPLVKGKRRHEVPSMNGLRRFFNKTNKEALSKDSPLAALIKKEYMMGHTGLVKLDRNYYQSHILELVEEYLAVVPFLTIDNTERERTKRVEAEKKVTELELGQARKMLEMESKIKSLSALVEKYLGSQK